MSSTAYIFLLVLFVGATNCLPGISVKAELPVTIVVHGGAGDVADDVVPHKYNASKVP
jgi:hypothetical protein